MKESVRVVRFMIVGTLNALIAAIVIWFFMDICQCNYRVSNVAGYIASLINNFVWSKYWVFAAPGNRFMREIPLFLLAFGCAYTMQFLSLLLMVEVLGLNAYLAQFLGLFVYGAVNFFMNKLVTFRKKTGEVQV
ncbi:MAG: GtrA family protein [Parabacteroides sp.]